MNGTHTEKKKRNTPHINLSNSKNWRYEFDQPEKISMNDLRINADASAFCAKLNKARTIEASQ